MANNTPSTTEKTNAKPRRIFPTALKLLAVLCVLALVPLVNYSVDPSALFVTNRADAPEIAAAALMLEGSDVTGLAPNYNERLLRREYILGMKKPVRVIVAGSSRGEFISSEMLGLEAGELFNVSVAGGELEDMLSFLGLLLERGLVPETVILSLDPWTVNDTFYQQRWRGATGDGLNFMLTELGESPNESYKTLAPLYNPEAPDAGFASLSDDVKKELLSVSYFQSSLQYFFSDNYALYKEVRASETRDGITGVVRADGSYSYALDYRSANAEIAAERAQRSLPNVLGVEEYSKLTGQKYSRLQALIEYLTERGIEVKLVMFPLGNTIYDYMGEPENRQRYANFFKTEELFRELAQETGVEITGSFDPSYFGYDMSDFYDGYHLREARVAEIVKELDFQTAG